MLYFQVKRDTTGRVISANVCDGIERIRNFITLGVGDTFTENRNDWKTLFEATEVADALGPDYIATDAGPNVAPRFDVIRVPQVGDKVSYSFNGDTYPCGQITSISKSLKLITTSEGDKFYRVAHTGSWKKDRTWFLVSGHHNERNPSF